MGNADVLAGTLLPDRIAGTAWTKTTDGAGSGLDADLLDGQQASAFAPSVHSHDADYVKDDAGEVGNADILAGTLLPDRIVGTAWTGANDGRGSGLDADLLDGQQASAFAPSVHNHDTTYVNDNAGEVDNTDILAGTLLPDRIVGTAWTGTTDGAGSGLDADLLDGQQASAFAPNAHDHDSAYVNDNAGEVGDADIIVGGLSPDKISGTAWTAMNDGTGSGLDADLLDGQQASAFAPSAHDHDSAYVNDNAGEVGDADIIVGGLSPDKISGTAWTGTNDGAGSGLDADLLDGQQASAFAPSTHDHDSDYLNDNAGEVGDADIIVGGLSPDKISGTAWTGTNDGAGSGLDADLLDGKHAADFSILSGTIVLGLPGDTRLLDAGYLSLGASNLTINGYSGVWLGETSLVNAPKGGSELTAIWTGSEMIIWGGDSGETGSIGGRYTPATNTWRTVSMTNAPQARGAHTAVWTGSEMIVWGGINATGTKLNSGGRYNPTTDTWTPISTTNAPAPRAFPEAVWTGSEMLIWGGESIDILPLSDGSRYNPITDTWTAISTTNAPAPRMGQTAVWTGAEWIMWGGIFGRTTYFNTGARYNPVTDTWTSTSTMNSPEARYVHKAVWTGSEMIIWGGANDIDINTGGRYNPLTDTWTLISTTNAPKSRYAVTVIWTGSEMVIWGGANATSLSTGAIYSPVTDSWVAISTLNAPTGRYNHTAVWTGSEMIIWGGNDNVTTFNTGGRFSSKLFLYQKP